MAGLRDVVQGLLQRDGVDAVVVISGDGLTIDHATRNGLDTETIAALIPGLAQNARRLGAAATRGDLSTGVLEFGAGLAIFTDLGQNNLLLVLVQPNTNVGALLFDLRRHRPAISQLL